MTTNIIINVVKEDISGYIKLIVDGQVGYSPLIKFIQQTDAECVYPMYYKFTPSKVFEGNVLEDLNVTFIAYDSMGNEITDYGGLTTAA